MERGDDAEAARLIMTALDETNWQIGGMQRNLSLALSRMLTAQSLPHSGANNPLAPYTMNPVSGHAGATVSVDAARLQPRTLCRRRHPIRCLRRIYRRWN